MDWTLQGEDVRAPTPRRARSGADLHRRGEQSAAGAFASAIAGVYFDFYEPRTERRSAPLHDLLAAQIAVEPDLAEYDHAAVDVLTADDGSRGMTVVDRRSWCRQPGPIAVARQVDATRAVRTWFERLDALP